MIAGAEVRALRSALLATFLACNCTWALSVEPPISLPELRDDVFRMGLSDSMKTVQDLVAQKKYDQALEVCEAKFQTFKSDKRLWSLANEEWALVCEKLGKHEEAARHFAIAGNRIGEATALIEQGEYARALKALGSRSRTYSVLRDTPLRLRAAAEAGEHHDCDAVRDLTEAATYTYAFDGEVPTQCVADANKLIERSHLGTPLSLDTLPMPDNGREKVAELIKFLIESPDPLKNGALWRYTGGEVRLTGHVADETCRNGLQPPFDRIEERLSDNVHQASIELDLNQCCFPMAAVRSLMPARMKVFRKCKHVQPQILLGFEDYKLPSGVLDFVHGSGGAEALTVVNFSVVKNPDEARTANVVSLPELKIERDLVDGNDDLDYHIYWKDPDCPAELQHARQLLRKGHAKEALTLFEKYAPRLPVDSNLRPTVYDEWGLVYEKLGRFNDAVQCFAGSGDRLLRARALVETGKYEQAKTTLQPVSSPDRQAIDFWRWHISETGALRLRAAAEAGLHQDNEAIADLTTAAMLYYESLSQSEPAQRCINDANALIDRDHSDSFLSLESLPLPDTDCDRVAALVRHCITAEDPFDHAELGKIVGCDSSQFSGGFHSRRAGATFGSFGESDMSGFFRGDHRVWCVLNARVCFLPESTIEGLLPHDAKLLSSEPDRLFPSAVNSEWQLAHGRLQLTAGRGGGKAVHVITFIGESKSPLLNMR